MSKNGGSFDINQENRYTMYMIYADSAIEPFNPSGILTWAFITKLNGKIIHKDTKIHGWGNGMTNNLGECLAVMNALKWLIGLPIHKRWPTLIMSDSELTIKHCNKEWAINDARLKIIHNLIDKARQVYKKSITFKWIPREKNTEADALSRSLYTPKMIETIKKYQLKMTFGDDDIPF